MLDRRTLLKGLSGSMLAAQFPLLSGLAQAADDYKALVCVFLYGGNDGNNTVLPIDPQGYAAYAAARKNLALAQSSLVPLNPASGTARFGLHPDLAPLQAVWDAGALGVVFNIGTLIQPLTRSAYKLGNVAVPDSLFSHPDQQRQSQSASSGDDIRSGWGGRIVDVLNLPSGVPASFALDETAIFSTGSHGQPLVIPSTGGFALDGYPGGYGPLVNAAYLKIQSAPAYNAMIKGAQAVTASALSNSAVIGPIVQAASSVDGLFSSLGTTIGNQLWRVAKLIAGRSAVGAARQIFFVSLGGFDTHANQLPLQSQLFRQLGPALATFNTAMQNLGVGSQVTTFTLSDFSRTLKPSTSGGSDHAWGNHQFVMGGAVSGRNFYGAFPDLTLGGADDAGEEGRWLPTLSIDQYGATLAGWFGLNPAQLAAVFPNLANFASANVGFLKT